MIVGVKSWALGVGLATVAAGFLGAMAGGWRSKESYGPADCVSSAEIIDASKTARHCRDGARIEVWPAGAVALVKCVCPEVTP